MSKRMFFAMAFSCLFAASATHLRGASDLHADVDTEQEGMIKGLTVAKGFKVQLWTDSKQLMNPIAISFDDQNRLYVTSEFRFRIHGVMDIREHRFMYYDDMLCKTTADRLANYQKYKDKYAPDFFTKYKEKIMLLEDSAKTGKADKTTVYAEAFNDPLDGPGVGIVYHDGKVYYACCPRIWELSPANGKDPAQKLTPMFDGFGVRVSISGHDVHGLVVGPDGKLYWSMGDRGYNVTSREGKKFFHPHSGGVFRCNLDGSDLELYYQGLRNPQELVFDEFGNLFTCDNNADIGDISRFTYILDGGDSGWTHGWQLLTTMDFPNLVGINGHKPSAWLEEGLWKMRFDKQPAHILPPAGLITNGPVGIACYPGVGLPESYNHHFFICDYTAGTNSGVHTFTADEDGAGFLLKNPEKFLWGVTATDVDFGYDGRIYVADYGGGWSLPNKGCILAMYEPDGLANPLVKEVGKLFADGFSQRETKELSELLKHVDMRVRRRAQFELAKRGKDGLAALTAAAKTPGHILSRVHGIWGLGQLAGKEPDALGTLVELLADKEARVREQAAKSLGDLRYAAAGEKLAALLKDPNPRVKTFAAIALGRINYHNAIPALIQVLRDNDDKDAFVRHGAVMALVGAADRDALEKYAGDSSRAVRLGVLLAWRRMADPRIAGFLKDSEPQLYAEAVRAIYDVPIVEAMPQLAAEIHRVLAKPAEFPDMTALLYNRILNANFRYGSAESAALIAEFAAGTKAPDNIRIFALELMEKWEEPTVVDPVLGLPRAVPKHEKLVVDARLTKAFNRAIESENGEISSKATQLCFTLGIDLKDELLLSFVTDGKRPEELRVTSIQRLMKENNAKIRGLLPSLLEDGSLKVRIAALDAFLATDPKAATSAARELLANPKPLSGPIRVVKDRTADGKWESLKIGPPSKNDYADKNSGNGAIFFYVPGYGHPIEKVAAEALLLPRLNDGILPENQDDIFRNTWIDGGESRFLLDLKKSIEIGAVNTYSWHVKDRSPQQFTLWGSDAETMPDCAAKDLSKEWKNIAVVDTAYLGDGGMHGSAIYAPSGTIGKYRYLLWQNTKAGSGTFYSEMDVYEKGKWTYPDPEINRLKQQVLISLGKAKDSSSAEVLLEWLDAMSAGKIPPVLHLDLIEAADMRSEDAVKKKMAEFRKGFAQDDKLAEFRLALQGGDSKCGEQVFQVGAASCLRCHKIWEVGGDAGPKLAGVGTRLTREKILESLIEPSAVIVPGYGSATFKLNDGRIIAGTIVKEDEKGIVVKQPDGTSVTLTVSDIKKRTPPVSPMPPMGQVLKPREIRDLIEYLSTLK